MISVIGRRLRYKYLERFIWIVKGVQIWFITNLWLILVYLLWFYRWIKRWLFWICCWCLSKQFAWITFREFKKPAECCQLYQWLHPFWCWQFKIRIPCFRVSLFSPFLGQFCYFVTYGLYCFNITYQAESSWSDVWFCTCTLHKD